MAHLPTWVVLSSHLPLSSKLEYLILIFYYSSKRLASRVSCDSVFFLDCFNFDWSCKQFFSQRTHKHVISLLFIQQAFNQVSLLKNCSFVVKHYFYLKYRYKQNLSWGILVIIFLKRICVLVRVEIIHKSKFLPGTVEKNSSTIRSSGRNRTHACAMTVHCSDH